MLSKLKIICTIFVFQIKILLAYKQSMYPREKKGLLLLIFDRNEKLIHLYFYFSQIAGLN